MWCTIIIVCAYLCAFSIFWGELSHYVFEQVQAITAGVLSAISDIVAQKLTGIQKLQLKRLLLKIVSLILNTEAVSV